MELKSLKDYLDRLISLLDRKEQKILAARLEGLVSVFPFNEYEYILMYLLNEGAISFKEYERLRNNYVSENRYLNLYELAPRIFGQIWGESHLMDMDSRFRKPSKTLDAEYDGQYDLWIDEVRVEVKAARAINTKKRGSLVSKALRHGSAYPFWMNFQQIKLDVCDVFVFIAVWVDKIVYWVMSNDEVKNSGYLSHQHRGGIEYQIGITDRNIGEFEKYEVAANQIADTVIAKGQRG